MKSTAYVFDLDGTIANNLHRLEWVERDWDHYQKLATDDTPYSYIVDLMEMLSHQHTHIFICTSRDETQRALTQEWLKRHEVKYGTLLMAEPGDTRPHADLKESMIDFIRALDYEIVCAFEDRPSCVRMFRANGIPCLATDDSSWDE